MPSCFQLVRLNVDKVFEVNFKQCGFKPYLPALKWLNRRKQMYTLTISQIFSNFSFYQDQYLQILQDPQLYYLDVADAYIDVWLFARQKLYLGDLLQLWLSDKWFVTSQAETLLDVLDNKPQKYTHGYVFQVNGSFLSTVLTSKAWSQDQQNQVNLSLDNVLKFYFVYKALSRPSKNSQQLSWVKSST